MTVESSGRVSKIPRIEGSSSLRYWRRVSVGLGSVLKVPDFEILDVRLRNSGLSGLVQQEHYRVISEFAASVELWAVGCRSCAI